MGYKLLRMFTWAMVCFALSADSAQAHEPASDASGFVRVPGQGPVQQLLFGLPHQTPWANRAGSISLSAQQSWTNLWLYQEGRYRIDAEVVRCRLSGTVGLGRGLDVSITVPLQYTSGGILDGVIEGIHRGLGASDASRDEYARDQYNFYVNSTGIRNDWTGDDGRLLGWTPGNAVVTIRSARSFSDSGMRGALALHVKFPSTVEETYFGCRKVDVGFSGSLMRTMGVYHVYASAGAIYYGDRSFLGVRLAPWYYSGLVAAERRSPGSRHAWITQMTIGSKSAEDFSQLAHSTFELMTAYRYFVAHNTHVELGVVENLFYFDNTPDISIHLGISHGFGANPD